MQCRERLQFYGSVFGSLQVTYGTDPYSSHRAHLKKKFFGKRSMDGLLAALV
jgi:hypothetical protein